MSMLYEVWQFTGKINRPTTLGLGREDVLKALCILGSKNELHWINSSLKL